MIEAGAPNAGELQAFMARVCARPTGGRYGRIPDDPAQRFKGKKRRPRWGKRKSAVKGIIKAGITVFSLK